MTANHEILVEAISTVMPPGYRLNGFVLVMELIEEIEGGASIGVRADIDTDELQTPILPTLYEAVEVFSERMFGTKFPFLDADAQETPHGS